MIKYCFPRHHASSQLYREDARVLIIIGMPPLTIG